MVLTRNQKRKLNEILIEYIDLDENIIKKFKSSKSKNTLNADKGSEISESEISESEISESEINESSESEISIESESIESIDVSEQSTLNADCISRQSILNADRQSTDKQGIQKIIKESIDKLFKRNFKEKEIDLKDKDDYRKFCDLKEAIYTGDFFERKPIEDKSIKNIKKTFTSDEIKHYIEILENIKNNYKESAPSIFDILKMNVSIDQKKKLLEKVHHLANSEILTPEYNSNLKFLTSNIYCSNDPELLKLEEEILKSSVNNGISDSYKNKILKSKMSFNNKVIAYKKLEIMETYENNDTSEYAKYKNWMDSLLSVPFGIYNESIPCLSALRLTSKSNEDDIKNYILNVRKVLDKKLSFLEKPKDQILNIVSHMVRNPNANINAIGLHGVKGTGKSSVAQSIADALNRPLRTISLGGESDASNLTGHNFTYVGSMPGRFIEILRDTKTMSTVILCDELDKISETSQGKELIGTLIHLTDTTTNDKFNFDRYFAGIEFDLSKLLLIFTYNDASKIDKILADRLYKIKVDNYTTKEKLEITNKHIINTVLEKFNFSNKDIIFNQDTINYLVTSSNLNEGMRTIKTKIKIIISRINTLLLTKPEDNIIILKYKKLHNYYQSLPVTIIKEHVDILLNESITNDSENNDIPFGMYI